MRRRGSRRTVPRRWPSTPTRPESGTKPRTSATCRPPPGTRKGPTVVAMSTRRGACHYFAIRYALQCKVKEGLVMRDLDKALADIVAIRTLLAAGTPFRGYGQAAMDATGRLP